MPTPRSELGSAVAGNKVFVSGGIGLLGSMDSFEVYDVATDRWQKRVPLPIPLHHHGTAVLGDRVYVVGGYSDLKMRPTRTAWSYDLHKDVWRPIADLPGPRAGFVLIPFDGGLVVTGGVGKDERVLWKYSPGKNSWTEFGSPLPSPREHHGAVAFDGKILVFGGRWQGRNLNTVASYDATQNRWRNMAPMPTARSGISAAVLNGRVHVIGGEDLDESCVYNSHEIYDPRDDSWLVGEPAPTGRHGLNVVAADKKLFVIGGARRAGIMTPLGVTSVVDVLMLKSDG
ncbi:MAG: hypothetical protein GTO40_13405 [Deltaproteobacteria bacterium]|nr:hypothetical protein [Deltaproteobacteria bacterium]